MCGNGHESAVCAKDNCEQRVWADSSRRVVLARKFKNQGGNGKPDWETCFKGTVCEPYLLSSNTMKLLLSQYVFNNV
jgi:hypothetical protein